MTSHFVNLCRTLRKEIYPIKAKSKTQPRLCEGSMRSTDTGTFSFHCLYLGHWDAEYIFDHLFERQQCWQAVCFSIRILSSSITNTGRQEKSWLSFSHISSSRWHKVFSSPSSLGCPCLFSHRGAPWAAVVASPSTSSFPFFYFIFRSLRKKWVIAPSEVCFLKICPSGRGVRLLILLSHVWWNQPRANVGSSQHPIITCLTHGVTFQQWMCIMLAGIEFARAHFCLFLW